MNGFSSPSVVRARIVVVFALVGLVGVVGWALLLSACSDPVQQASPSEDEPQQAAPTDQAGATDQAESVDSADLAQTTETDAEQSEPSPSAASSSGSVPGFAVTGETTWGAVFETLSAEERSCIAEALDAESLESALAAPVTLVAAEGAPEPWEVTIFGCLDPQVARSLFVAVMILEIQTEESLQLSGAAQTCLHEWSAGIDAAALVAAAAEDDSEGLAEYLSGVVSCVPDLVVAGMLEESGMAIDDLSEAEASCLRSWVVELDWAGLVTAFEGDDVDAAGEFAAGMFSCVPRLFLAAMLSDSGTTMWELSEPEVSCLSEWAAGADWGLLMSAYEVDDATALGEFLPGLVSCLPDLMIAIFLAEWGITIDELTEEESSCLHGWVTEDDWATLLVGAGAGEARADELAGRLLECVPELLAQEPAEQAAPRAARDQEDDHSDSFDEVGTALVGEPVAGALDYEYDLDILSYELDAGQLYQIDVELGTLSDSVVTLYDGDSQWLASNDDHGGSTASRLYWTADDAAIYYVEVSGFGGNTGSYTLTVEASAIDDDHANSTEDATPAAVGEAADGSLDYEGDLDVFAVELEAGRLYQIDVELDTLSDSVATLYDAEGAWLAMNDDRPGSLASRIYWEATSSGTHYIEVSAASFGGALAGSYTLTVVER